MGGVVMSIPEVLSIIIQHRTAVLIPVGVIPLVTFVLGFLHGVYDGRKAPWRQIYALLIYISTVGMTVLVSIIAYLYVLGNDPVSEIGFFLPVAVVVSWLLTVLFVKRVVDLKYLSGIPGIFFFIIEFFLVWATGLFIYWSEIWFILDDPIFSLFGASGIAFVVLHTIFISATKQSRR